jgi:protein-disulfide isomerase
MSSTDTTNRNRKPGDKDKEAARRAVASAQRTRKGRGSVIAWVAVIGLLAVAVIGGVLYQNHQRQEAAVQVIPAAHAPGNSPAAYDQSTATVLVGNPAAKTTVDTYEDFLCPICGEFEKTEFPLIQQQLSAGTIKVRYHLLNLLDDRSNPPGYSVNAANTALAVAAAAPDKFLDFHYSLFQRQPQENGPGWTQDQLTSLANRLGVSGGQFDNMVAAKANNARIQQNVQAASSDPALQQKTQQGTGFGTPTVVVNGKTVNWQQPSWLDAAAHGG